MSKQNGEATKRFVTTHIECAVREVERNYEKLSQCNVERTTDHDNWANSVPMMTKYIRLDNYQRYDVHRFYLSIYLFKWHQIYRRIGLRSARHPFEIQLGTLLKESVKRYSF